MPRGGGTANGGIIGKANNTSFGKNTITSTTSTGNFTTQPGTRLVNTLVVVVHFPKEALLETPMTPPF